MSDPLVTAVRTALDTLGKSTPNLSYEIISEIPQQRGMGSSAAVAIAAIRSVFDYFDKPLSDNLLEQLVNQAEIVAHKNPSGLDAKTCLSDTAICYVRNVGFRPLSLDLDAYLVIADTGIHGKTSQAVEMVAKEKKNLYYLRELGKLAEESEIVIKEKNVKTLGMIMNQAHQNLQSLGVSCSMSDKLVEKSLLVGALGAKMSGGGLGGCIIALSDSKEVAISISQLLKEEGAYQTWIEKL